MKLWHIYHCYTGGSWQEPLHEHVEALVNSEFPYPWKINAVAEGFEQDTINKVREYAQTHDGAVLYAHTKGACDATPFRAEWRRGMCDRVVSNWRENLAMLDNVDAVGCHWLTREVFGNMVETPFFGGNYWMATCAYLRTLPECSDKDRFQAERWIGLRNPTVVNLLEGWPTEGIWD